MNTKIIGICCILFSFLWHLHAQEISVDPTTEHQVIRGFGGMNHTTWIDDLNEDNREKAFDNDPGEMGLSILRIHLDPNYNNFNLELPTAQYAYNHGAKVFATPWNAPDELIEPNSEPSRVDPDKYLEYVEHLNAFNTYMADNGVNLYALSVQNEPDYGEWTRWTSSEMVEFLANHGQNIENTVIAPESFQFRRSFTDPILEDDDAVANLDIVGGHIYGGGLFEYPLAQEKGKEVWMTEHLTGSDDPSDNTWSLALDMAEEINDCMKANFNAYIWWYIRRFYSLINDAGNITKKGYVMSQFSKFIRPGFTRVDASVASASNVDVSAYKTDTSFVLVVINKNSQAYDFSFNIPNSGIDSLTRFTTSSSKNVMNDGVYKISDGTFESSVDAKSITTFTSYAAHGGKYENKAPVADLGPDLELIDNDGDHSEKITLDASNSYDPDGTISNFSWSLNGQQISTDTSLKRDLGTTDYRFVLTITDKNGSRDFDTLNVSVRSPYSTHVWLEAESSEVGENWNILQDEQASKEKYVMAAEGNQRIDNASEDADDLVKLTFNVDEAAEYIVWGRVITPSYDDDSFWIKMDDGPWTLWNGIAETVGNEWGWDDIHDGNGEIINYDLDKGDHTLSICYREDGAQLDKIYITNTGSEPSGIGEEASNYNNPPMAHAGEDSTIIDNNNDGTEFITLDGSASSDPDGDVLSYSWKTNNEEIASSAQSVINLSIGTYKIFLTVTDEFDASSTDSVIIIINSPNRAPIADAGADITITDSNGDGEETVSLDGSASSDPNRDDLFYLWKENEDTLGESINPSFDLPVGTHEISLTVTDDSGASDTDTVIVTINLPNEIIRDKNKTSDQVVSVFPNPAIDKLYIKSKQTLDKKSILKVYNNQGSLILKKPFKNPKTIVDISHLNKGLYLIEIRGSKKSVWQKFIKK